MPPATATVALAAGRRKGAAKAEASSTRPFLALAAGLAGAAVAATAGCMRSDACASTVAPLLWRARPAGYAVPATPASRFGSAVTAPLPGTAAAASKAAAEASKRPPPPADGPIPGMWVDGGVNALRGDDTPAWPARVRVERSRMFPRKAGALEAAVKELEAEGVALLVDDAPNTPWDLLLPSRVGGMERLRLAEAEAETLQPLRPGQVVATLPEPLTHRRNFALLARNAAAAAGRAAAKKVWSITPPVFALPQDKAAWLDAGNADPASKWIMKTGAKGHPANGHDWGQLSEMAAAAMLPVTHYELAQQVVAPPALPLLLGERATLRVFVLITSLRPLRAYIHSSSSILVVRDPAAVAAAAVRASVRPTFQQWVAPWNEAAPLIAAAGGPSKPARMAASARAAIASTLAWAPLDAPLGDPHGDMQFSPVLDASAAPASRGKAWDLLVANVAFDRRYRGSVVDWEPALPSRLVEDHAVYLAPATARGGADREVVSALKGAVELSLRRRERWLARDAGVCAPGNDGAGLDSSALPPPAWRAGGDPCASLGDEDAWEAAAAAGVGFEAVVGPGVKETKRGGKK